MRAVIEIRTYPAKPGMRAQLLELLHTRAFPIQRELGTEILGPFASHEDEVGLVWLRGFPDEGSRVPLKAAFYEGAEQLGSLEAQVMLMPDATPLCSSKTQTTCGHAGPLQLVLEGSRLHLTDGEPVRLHKGVTSCSSKGEWQAFANDTSEATLAVTLMGGVARYSDYSPDPSRPRPHP